MSLYSSFLYTVQFERFNSPFEWHHEQIFYQILIKNLKDYRGPDKNYFRIKSQPSLSFGEHGILPSVNYLNTVIVKTMQSSL